MEHSIIHDNLGDVWNYCIISKPLSWIFEQMQICAAVIHHNLLAFSYTLFNNLEYRKYLISMSSSSQNKFMLFCINFYLHKYNQISVLVKLLHKFKFSSLVFFLNNFLVKLSDLDNLFNVKIVTSYCYFNKSLLFIPSEIWKYILSK